MDRSQAIRAIRDAADLVALVSERAKIKKSGSGWLGGPCPIHGGGTRTACLSVVPEKGNWHCFGCGKGGDAFDWLQETQGLTFEEDLEDLSKRSGIALPTKEAKQVDSPEERMLRATAAAQDFYTAQLRKNRKAMEYLASRGLTPETIEREGIGYAPAGWDETTRHLGAQGIKPELAELAGISVRSQRGTLIDMLRDRISVPISDPRGRVIAFGGRTLPGAPEGTPIYLNTRETAIFKKGEALFHLHQARAFLREEGALVCEGYFDAIALAQVGIQSAVAPMGTALTAQHLQALKRWTNRITLAFDADPAGMNATHKTLALALPLGFEVRLLTMPEGDDPDTWAMREGPRAKVAIQRAPDWATFALDKAKDGRDLRRMEDRLAAAREVAEWIAYLPAARQEEVVAAAAHELNVPAQSLRPKASTKPQGPQAAPRPTHATGAPMDDAITAMVAMAAKGGPFADWVRQLPRGWWDWRPGAIVLETLMDAEGDTEAMGPDTQAAVRAAVAKQAAVAGSDPKRLHLRLEREYLQREHQEILQRVAAHASDEQMAAMLHAELTEVRARIARLARGAR